MKYYRCKVFAELNFSNMREGVPGMVVEVLAKDIPGAYKKAMKFTTPVIKKVVQVTSVELLSTQVNL